MVKVIHKMLMLCFISLIVMPGYSKAGTYDNAYTYYDKFCKSSSDIAKLNSSDGYIYFCSRGTTATTSVKYRTIGYKISIEIDGKEDSVEVKLGGTYVKNVSEVKKNGYTYVLRRVKHSKLNSLFNGNKNITWNKIYQNSNRYRFDAIMTIVSNGEVLCGKVSESNDYRKITAENNTYMYRTLKGIKNARQWANPEELDSFFNKNVVFDACNDNIRINYMDVENTDNVYPCDGKYYVKNNSWVSIDMQAYMKDTTAADRYFHPNYNMYNISGWGNSQKFYISQGSSSSGCRPGKFYESGSETSPISYFDYNKSKTSGRSESLTYYNSCGKLYVTVADGESIDVTPEARIYYDSIYPIDNSDKDNMCDKVKATKLKKSFISDGVSPEIYVDTYIKEFGRVDVPFTVTDIGSGIRSISMYNSSNQLICEKYYNNIRQTVVESGGDFCVNAGSSDTYYIIAIDNVGNKSISNHFSFLVPRAYIINTGMTPGRNGYNCHNVWARVYGGNSEIASFTVMSDEDENPYGDRIVLVNKSVMSHTLTSGLREYSYSVDPTSFLEGKPDGQYNFQVISGGKYVSSTPGTFTILKDKTKPKIKYSTKGNADWWYNTDVFFTVNTTDNYSGVDNCSVYCDGEIMSGAMSQQETNESIKGTYRIEESGEHSIDITAIDRAGNEAVYESGIRIDKIRPFITLPDSLEGCDKSNEKWVNKAMLKQPILLSDSLSGFDYSGTWFNLLEDVDGGCSTISFPNAYETNQVDDKNAEFRFSDVYINQLSSGSYRYLPEIYDYAGNRFFSNLYINLDVDIPIISTAVTGGWDKEKLKGKVIIVDEHSGINSVVITCNDETIFSEYEIGGVYRYQDIDLTEYAAKNMDIHVIVTDMVGNRNDCKLEADYKIPGNDIETIGRRIRTRLRNR
ncbi:MAG: hypothetical protein E7265_00660 [Lachnospiraceae bacterium]|nr:hypothetical protein [Lachnospiraceae bacterium]